jgi:hypothetical protein
VSPMECSESSPYTHTIKYFTSGVVFIYILVLYTSLLLWTVLSLARRSVHHPPVNFALWTNNFACLLLLVTHGMAWHQSKTQTQTESRAVNQPNAQPRPPKCIDRRHSILLIQEPNSIQFNSIHHHVERCSCRRRE